MKSLSLNLMNTSGHRHTRSSSAATMVVNNKDNPNTSIAPLTHNRSKSSNCYSLEQSLEQSLHNNNNSSHHNGSSTHTGLTSTSTSGRRSSRSLALERAPSLNSISQHPNPLTAKRMVRQSCKNRLQELTMDKLRFEKLELMGREEEQKRLERVFDDLFTSGSGRRRSLVLIAGSAGTGKTALATKTLAPKIEKAKGFFLTGKYSQHQSQFSSQRGLLFEKPYAGIAACCEELCEQVIAYSSQSQVQKQKKQRQRHEEEGDPATEQPSMPRKKSSSNTSLSTMTTASSTSATPPFPTMMELQAQLHAFLGSNEIAILTSTLPSLLPIIGTNPAKARAHHPHASNENDNDDNDSVKSFESDSATTVTTTTVDPRQAKNSFQYAFRQFMTFMSQLKPLVILIDDLQYSDPESLDLLGLLLKDTNSHGLDVSSLLTTTTSKDGNNTMGSILVVGTYRNDEMSQDLQFFITSIEAHISYHSSTSTTMNSSSGRHSQLRASYHPATMTTTTASRDHSFRRASNGCDPPLAPKQQQPGLSMFTIPIGNLTMQATLEILMELLSKDSEQVLPLAECVYRKTHGNVFFTIQYLTLLQRQKLLRFNYGLFIWSWDLEEIDKRTVATDNVVDLMSARLRDLPPTMHGLLALIASFGTDFSTDLLELVLVQMVMEGSSLSALAGNTKIDNNVNEEQQQKQSPDDILAICQSEGLIEPHGNGVYRWVHDRIQSAAMTLISDSQLEEVQFELGCLLLEESDKSDNNHTLERDIFVLINLFRNGCQRLVRDGNDPLRLRIADLYLKGGQKAIASSAFGQAATHLREGIALLPTSRAHTGSQTWSNTRTYSAAHTWKENYPLCLELYSTAAEAHFCVGDMEQTNQYCQEVLENTKGKPFVDRRRAYDTQIRGLMAKGRAEEASELIFTILSKLDVKFPKGKMSGVLQGAGKVLAIQLKTKQTIAKLSSRPITHSEIATWTMFLIFQLISCLRELGSKLLPLAVVKGLEYILKEGICEHAPSIVATVGLLLASSLKDPQNGKLFGEEAGRLLSRIKSNNYEARTLCLMAYFVLHWTTPAPECMKMLLKSYHSGMVVGDTEWASWSIFAYLDVSFGTSGSLEAIARDCRVYANEMKQLNQHRICAQTLIMYQTALNLMGESNDPLVLKGSVMDEDEMQQLDEYSRTWNMNLRRHSVQLAVILGDYERATEIILAPDFEVDDLGYFTVVTLYFHCALAFASMARQSQKRKKYHKLMTTYGKQIIAWSDKGNPNVVHHAALVRAEMCDLKSDFTNAGSWFSRSVMLAGRQGLYNDRAMAHERFGDFLLRQKDETEAKYHFNESISLYEEWGARAKVNQLRKLHEKLLAPPQEIAMNGFLAGANSAPP